jgi:hypothetical protein
MRLFALSPITKTFHDAIYFLCNNKDITLVLSENVQSIWCRFTVNLVLNNFLQVKGRINGVELVHQSQNIYIPTCLSAIMHMSIML